MDDVIRQLEALGLDPMFARRTAAELHAIGATVADFQGYLRHVHASSHRIQAHKRLRDRRLAIVKRLIAWTRFQNLWLELLALTLVAPLVLPMSVWARLACWAGTRKVQRQFCPWFREWYLRGIDSDSSVAIVQRRTPPHSRNVP